MRHVKGVWGGGPMVLFNSHVNIYKSYHVRSAGESVY